MNKELVFLPDADSDSAIVPFEERIFFLALFTQRENKVFPGWNTFFAPVILY